MVSFNLCCLGDFEARENRFIHNHGIDLQAKTRCDLIPEVGVSLVFFSFFLTWAANIRLYTADYVEVNSSVPDHKTFEDWNCRSLYFLFFFSVLAPWYWTISLSLYAPYIHIHRQLNQKEHRMSPFLSRTSLFSFFAFFVFSWVTLYLSRCKCSPVCLPAQVVFLRDRFRSFTCKTE